MSTDAIDLSQAVVHSSPTDIASWPVTTVIERLTMRPGQDNGLSFQFSGNATWPDYVPPGWDGPIQYTVWAGLRIGGRWHVAGFIQMWRTRPSTGAPILSQWRDWAYDVNRWGELAKARPLAGDQMVFFLSAGNARKGSAGPEPAVTSVRERSNIVLVSLPAGDDGVFDFLAPAPPVAPAPPAVAPAPAPPAATGGSPTEAPAAGTPDLSTVLAELRTLTAEVRSLAEAVKRIAPQT